MYAVGIDLAWSPRNPSGVAVAESGRRGWALREAAAGLESNHDILRFVRDAVDEAPAILAIDAPLVVRRWDKGRDGDRLVTHIFGPMEAGVYPATRRRIGGYGGKRIWDLVRDLEGAGFTHDCRVTPRRADAVVLRDVPARRDRRALRPPEDPEVQAARAPELRGPVAGVRQAPRPPAVPRHL